MAKKKRRRRGRGRGGGGAALAVTGKDKLYVAAGGAAYGYLETQVEAFKKVPVLGESKTAHRATHAVLFHYVARNTSGAIRKWSDLISVAASALAGHGVGAAGFDMDKVEGDDAGRLPPGSAHDIPEADLEGEVDIVGVDEDELAEALDDADDDADDADADAAAE